MRATITIATTALLLFFSACSDDSTVESPEPQPATEAAVHHIHGLGVAPDSGELFVATHGGLFVAGNGEQQLRRIGDSQQDIMGFSVVGPDHFIGSGHPDPDETASPPNLGLIESRDAGKTWSNVSLHGEADFHVLESSAERIYGFDGTQGRLMVSSDGGRRWTQRTPPAAMFDLASHPGDSDRIVASTERGIFGSADAGRTWRPLRDDTAGLLAWPAPDRLYLVDGQGQIHQSGDGGRQWQPRGSVGGQPVAFIAHESELYAALTDSTVKRSIDGGATWTVRAGP